MQKFTRSLFAVGAVLGLAACGDDVSVTPPTPAPAPTVTAVTVSPAQATIRVGEKLILSANVAVNGSGVNTAVTWSSANAAIASVSATGEVTGVGAGTTTIRAASAANAGVSGSAAISVTADKGVQSVVVAPSSAILAPGQTLQATANVTTSTGVAKTVTWASSAATVATVDATGKITAVGAGTATITATSTADNTVSGALALTVRVAAAASVSIKSITQQVNGLLVPVDQNNVFGQIDVTLNVDPGEGQLAKVAVLVDGVEAASQTFGSSNMVASSTGALVSPSEIVLSVNTAEYATATGATKFKNGPRKITAQISTIASGASAAAPAASVTQTLVFRNVSGFIGSIVASGNSASDQAGYNWRSGDLNIDALPVLYGDVVDPYNVPTVQTVKITFGQGCDTENIVRQLDATLTGAKWGVSFKNTASAVTGGGDVDNVFRYEYNPANCPNLLARGEVPSISAVVTDGTQLSTAAGGFLNSPYLAFSGNGVTPDARFAVRLDNRRPDRVAAAFDGVWQNSNTTSPIVRTNQWINDALVLNKTASNATARTQNLTRAFDGGVSRLADTEITYEVRLGTDNATADAASPATSVAALAESSANDTYTMRASIKDKLGNTLAPSSTTTGGGTRKFGVDRTNPVLALDSATTTLDSDSTINVAPITAIAVPFIATDTASGGATPSGFFNLAGNPLTTEVRRVEVSSGSALTRYYCPASTSFVSTATGCSSWVTAQSYLAPLTTSFNLAGFGTLEGYYRVTSVVTDQAGNQSTTQTQNVLYDITAPAVGGISYPAFLNGGQTVSFTTQANDNVDLDFGTMWLQYTLFADNFEWPKITLGSFGSDVFTTSAPLQLQTAFIRSVQIATGGASPVAALQPPTAVFASVTDVGGNSSATSTSAIPVGSIPLTTASTNWNAIPFTWAQTAPAAAVTVDRESGGSNSQTVTITAKATGPTGTFQNPFTSRVEFWVQDAAGATWRRIGASTSPSVTDNGTNRVWSFSITWNPEGAYTAPFATGTTNVRIIAIGVNAAGDALSTDPADAASTLVSVLVP